MKVLGYCGGLPGYMSRFGTSHDAAAALVVDGVVVAAAEEERFNREKFSGDFPVRAIDFCLRQAGISSFSELDLVCFNHSESRMWQRAIVDENTRMRPLYRGLLKATVSSMRLAHRWLGHSDAMNQRIFEQELDITLNEGQWRALSHHLCHAASAFYECPWDEALTVVLDAQGESSSSSAFLGDARGLHRIAESFAPNSVGYLYQAITRFLGFGHGDEYKVMGLAPYGDPSPYRRFFDSILRNGRGGRIEVDRELMAALVVRDGLLPMGALYPHRMRAALGPPRLEGEELSERHQNIAAALQEALERVVFAWLEVLARTTGSKHVCLAGGVALNCTMNGKLARSGIFEGVHVAPASHDAGNATGAALYGHHALLGGTRSTVRSAQVYLGPTIERSEVEEARNALGDEVHARLLQRPAQTIAVALDRGEVVGFAHGRMEWGPRALGNRSILADARRPDMKDIVNHAVKLREGFRPFAPVVMAEHAERWFDLRGLGGQSPYMLFTVPVRPEKRALIPAVTHIDGTARVQTVRREQNPELYAVLEAFYLRTGVPVLMNTSFNVKGEPIVCTALDAMRCFLGTGIDLLFMEETVVAKTAEAADRVAAEDATTERRGTREAHAIGPN